MSEKVPVHTYEFSAPALTDEGVTRALSVQVDAARANADLAAANQHGMPIVPLPSAVVGEATARLCVQASMMTRF